MKEISLPDGRIFSWREDGRGAPLVLIHGWGSSSSIFAELIAELQGQHTFAPDLPGYGASSPAVAVDLDALAADFIDWFDALALGTVTLLGWSLGGILAQHLAARFPQRIKALILIATTPCFVKRAEWPHGLADIAVRSLARDFKRGPLATLKSFQALQFQGEEIVPLPLLPLIEMETALGGLELLRQVDLRNELERINQPALILHGASDLIIPIAAGRFLAATLAQGRFHEVSGCGHAPFRSDVAQVSAAIRNFLL